MGADLFIDSINKRARAEWQPKFDRAVEWRDSLPRDSADAVAAQLAVSEAYDGMYSEAAGYFRDSYNCTSVIRVIGVPWPRTDIHNDDGSFWSLVVMEALRDEVIRHEVPNVEVIGRHLESRNATVDTKDNSLVRWHTMFVESREQLLRFLSRALELREPVRASL